MNRQHQYNLTITWTGNTGQGTSDYRSYDRGHTVTANSKAAIFCSSDPIFLGDKAKYNPEELLLAALSGCHMLSYLHLCATEGVVVIAYSDNATGTMEETANGGGHFTEVNLNPQVVVTDISMLAKANEFHHKANQLCFIAASCNFPIHHKPGCTVKTG
ncbi:MAG: OsmC family protein [Ginsengibacter sp.]